MRPFRVPVILIILAALMAACQSTPVAIETREPTPSPTLESRSTAAVPTEPPSDLSQLYQTVSQGVVSIVIYVDEGPHSDSVPISQGSGFVVDDQGHIVTNQHVIDGAAAIEVDFPSGLKAWAEVIGSDPNSDLAVIRVEVGPEFLHPLPLSQANNLQIGDTVVAIGNPFGLNGTMTVYRFGSRPSS